MKKVERKNKKKHKGKHTLYDFLPKDVIEEFIEFKNDPEYKKECEETDAELVEILEDFEDRLGREMTKYEYHTVIGIMKKHSPKDKNGHVFVFLPAEAIWEVYCYERGEKWDLWEEFLK